MSIAAMADNRLLREMPAVRREDAEGLELPDGGKVPSVQEGTLNAIVQWIPLETIGAYIFLQTLLLDPLSPGPDQQLSDLNFDARWRVFGVGLLLTLLSVPLYTAVKQRIASARFTFPWAETFIGGVAFVLWAAAIPDTPASDWEWWSPDYGAAAIAVSAVFLNPIATLLGVKAQWGKTPTT